MMKKILLFIFSFLAFTQMPQELFGESKITQPESDCLPQYQFDGKKLVLTAKEWRERLTPEQFKILREDGTETAFKNIYHDNKKNGIYICAGCDLPLYSSSTKFDSGTGWPSFWKPLCKGNITITEKGWVFKKNEVSCSRCGGHLGDVFDDGPPPTNQRYCMNSASLKFVANE